MKLYRFPIFATAALLAVFSTITPAQAATGGDARKFVRTVSVANQFEILSSQLALEQSQNEDVREFAQAMIDDHKEASKELKSAAMSSKVKSDAIRTSLDKKHQAQLDKLKQATGPDFDREYIAAQTQAHKEAVNLFRDYSRTGRSKPLKDFADKTLPTLQGHLDHVKQLEDSSS